MLERAAPVWSARNGSGCAAAMPSAAWQAAQSHPVIVTGPPADGCTTTSFVPFTCEASWPGGAGWHVVHATDMPVTWNACAGWPETLGPEAGGLPWQVVQVTPAEVQDGDAAPAAFPGNSVPDPWQ